MSKDISIKNITVRVPGKTLLQNTDFVVSSGTKYGLIGKNGIGKSSLLKQISDRVIPIPHNIDMFYVTQEMDFDDEMTVYEIVLSANRKRMKLMKRLDEVNELLEEADEKADSSQLVDEKMYAKLNLEYNDISEQLENLDCSLDESIIRKILHGLGFSQNEQNRKFKEFSGGWKMRVSIARGLYMKPTLLLLDEPTNHLDLNAVIWLTDYLIDWKKSLIVVSHDSHFINQICNCIIHIHDQKLNYYKGDYDGFKKSYQQHIAELTREWKIVQNRVKEMRKKNTSKKETQKFLADNAHKEPPKDYQVRISFSDPPKIRWPSLVLKDVSFGFENGNDENTLFKSISLSLYEGEKIVIVGENGVGKSTILNILKGDLEPKHGEIIRDSRLHIGFYNQHVSDTLPPDMSPVEFLQSIDGSIADFEARKILGSTSLEGSLHLKNISTLSGGQKARVVISSLTAGNPHILLLDEPTNHLDAESIDSFINAINEFSGAVIMITHNIDVIEKTDSIIYELADEHLIKTDFETYYNKVLKDNLE
jgi:ATP-binding cassette, subfamily F, member 1